MIHIQKKKLRVIHKNKVKVKAKVKANKFKVK